MTKNTPQTKSSQLEARKERHQPLDQSTQETVVESRTLFAGPIPPPEVLLRYNDVLPTAAERIMTMAESAQKHVERMEENGAEYRYKTFMYGRWFGFSALVLLCSVALITAYWGHTSIAATALGVSAVGVIIAFIVNNNTQKEPKESATDKG